MIHRVATTVERGDRYALGALSITSTRDLFAIAEAMDTPVKELKFAKCRSITDKRSVGRDRDVGQTEVGTQGRVYEFLYFAPN
jgi:hypothetical protein